MTTLVEALFLLFVGIWIVIWLCAATKRRKDPSQEAYIPFSISSMYAKQLPPLAHPYGQGADGLPLSQQELCHYQLVYHGLVLAIKRDFPDLKWSGKVPSSQEFEDKVMNLSTEWIRLAAHAQMVPDWTYLKLFCTYFEYCFPRHSREEKQERKSIGVDIQRQLWDQCKPLRVFCKETRANQKVLQVLEPFFRVDYFGYVITPLASASEAMGAYHMDHFLPHSCGGPVSLNNLVLVNGPLNRKKSASFNSVLTMLDTVRGMRASVLLGDLTSEARIHANPLLLLIGYPLLPDTDIWEKGKVKLLIPRKTHEVAFQALVALYQEVEQRICQREPLSNLVHLFKQNLHAQRLAPPLSFVSSVDTKNSTSPSTEWISTITSAPSEETHNLMTLEKNKRYIIDKVYHTRETRGWFIYLAETKKWYRATYSLILMLKPMVGTNLQNKPIVYETNHVSHLTNLPYAHITWASSN